MAKGKDCLAGRAFGEASRVMWGSGRAVYFAGHTKLWKVTKPMQRVLGSSPAEGIRTRIREGGIRRGREEMNLRDRDSCTWKWRRGAKNNQVWACWGNGTSTDENGRSRERAGKGANRFSGVPPESQMRWSKCKSLIVHWKCRQGAL